MALIETIGGLGAVGALLASWEAGDPRKWWSYFVGTTVHANLLKLTEREQAGENSDALQEEIHQWVQSGTKGSWIRINPYTYKFLKKSDATFFKLAWG
jgi:hypothetical protein